MPGAVGNAVIFLSAALRYEIQLPKSQAEEQNVSTMKMGRYGSRAVRWPIQAPPMPRLKSRSGPTQHAEAPIPASRLPARASFVFALDNDRIRSPF